MVHPSSRTIADANSATAETNPGYVLSAQNQLFPQAVLLEPGLAPWLGPKPGCAARVAPAGFGSTHPDATNSDPQGRALDRRVDATLLVNKGLQGAM